MSDRQRARGVRGRLRQRGWGLRYWGGVALCLFPLATAAWAHTHLKHSTPAEGARLTELPRAVRLAFTGAVDLALLRLELRGADGSPVALAPAALVADSPGVVIARIDGALAAGSYTVSWQLTGADGHPVRGAFGFTVAPEAVAEPMPAGAPDAGGGERGDGAVLPSGPPEGVAPPEPAVFGAESPLYAAVRGLTFAGVLGVVGVAAFQLGVLPLFGRRRVADGLHLIEGAQRRAVRLGVGLAALLGAGVGLRLLAQGYALGGGRFFDGAGLRAMLAGGVWGWGWRLQAAAAVAALLGLRWVGRGRRAGRWVLGAAALALAFALSLSGHAAGGEGGLTLLADAAHVLGAGGWLGGLLVVLGAGVPAALALEEGRRGGVVAALVEAFSRTALLFAALLIATGLFGAWVHLGSLDALWQSGYGRTLLVKLALFALVLAAGAYNFLRLRPSLGDEGGARRFRRSATIELVVAVGVLAVTAVLVALPTPREEGVGGGAEHVEHVTEGAPR